MKAILAVLFVFLIQTENFAQKEKTVTEYYYKDLKKAEGKVDKNGKKTGEWTYWEVTGRICENRNYKNDMQEGMALIERFYKEPKQNKLDELINNQSVYDIALKRQKNDILDSVWAKENYSNNKKEGVSYYYNVNKILSREASYHEDKLHGVEKIYAKGKLVEEEFYTNGKNDSIIMYDCEGYEKISVVRIKLETISKYYTNNKIVKTRTSYEKNDYKITIVCEIDTEGKKKCDSSAVDTRDDRDFMVVDIPVLKEEVVVDEIFDVVEEKPQYPGGVQELYNFIGANFKFDPSIKEPVNGKIYVSFIIEKDGSITEPKIMQGLPQESLNKEALRVVGLMPKWTPGKQRGKVVRVRYNLPIVVKYAKK
jgi:protein TonB